ncbi:MAG: DNA internalization-related competence protein ComEC/Rec2 [Gammaproteobacteria bacterium]|nr:DNA internalization-related competence protein ComEC/Rec2 [Gammaproteobacteria bacterium]
MRTGTLAFFAGVLLVLQLPELPDARLALLLPASLVLAAVCLRARVPALAVAGFLWALLRADLALSGALPLALEGREVTVVGTVVGVPEREERALRFELRVEAVEGDAAGWQLPVRVRVDWYDPVPALATGERWRLTTRLRRPKGLSNPGGFDYEAWLLLRGLRATGYVRPGPRDGRLAAPAGVLVNRVRGALAARIDRALDGHPHRGVVKGLVVGLTGDVPVGHWEVFRATGTTHLMAISGSHVVLVAALVYAAARGLWAAAGTAALRVAAPRVAALCGLLAAAGYAALAGLSVPTQRAVVMAGVVLLARAWRGRVSAGHALALALLAVLLADPLSPLAPGFWLSFLAVGVLVLISVERGVREGPWHRWGRPHLLVAIGLMPVTLAVFGENPWVGPVANAVAVPWVGLLVVPPALLGSLLVLAWPAGGAALLGLSALAMDGLWPLLEALAGLDWTYRGPVAPGPAALAAAGLGVLLALLPRGVPGRWLGLLGLLPLLLPPLPRPAPGEVWLTLLDVGQGLSAVVATAEHVLVYDAGPRYGPGRDAGGTVVAPVLRRQGWGRVDTLLLSHPDADHVGGAASVLRGVRVAELMGSPAGGRGPDRPCAAGAGWAWDGVRFRVLHPAVSAPRPDNDASCVLRVETGGGALLLPGDVEARAEAELVAGSADLRADVLVVPHHGSRGASSPAFVAAVAPRHALFATGYGNRFRFPAAEVLARYRAAGAEVHDTARAGAIEVRLDRAGRIEVRHYRAGHRRFWHTPLGPD